MAKMISRKKFLKRYPYAFRLVEVIDLISSWPIQRAMKTPYVHAFKFQVGGGPWDTLIVSSNKPCTNNRTNLSSNFPAWAGSWAVESLYKTTPEMRSNTRLIVGQFSDHQGKLEGAWDTITLAEHDNVLGVSVACYFGGVRNESVFFIPHALVSLPLIQLVAEVGMEIVTRSTLQQTLNPVSSPSVPPDQEDFEDMDSDEGWGEDDWDEDDDEDYEAGEFEESEEEEFEDGEEEDHLDDGFEVEPPEEMSVESQDAMVDLLLGSIGRDCTTNPEWFRPNSYATKSHSPFDISHIAAMWDRSEGQYSRIHFDDDVTSYTFYKEVTGEDERDVEVARYDHHKNGVRIDSRVEDPEAALRRLREEPQKLLETLQASSPGFMGAVTRVDGKGVRFVVSDSTANLIDWWLNHPAHDFLGNEGPIPEHLLPPRIQYDPKTHAITYSGIGASVSSRHYKDDAGVRAQLQKQIRFSLRRLFVFYPHIANELLKAYFPDENLSHEDLWEAASKEDPRFMVAQDLHNEGDQYAMLENYRQAKFKHLRKLIARGITPGAPPQE